MDFVVDHGARTPVYQQITDWLRQRILSGELRPGSKLPSERKLATILGVNRTTIVTVYDDLAAEGLVSGHVGRGTTVIYRPEGYGKAAGIPMSWNQILAAEPWDASSEMRQMLAAAQQDDFTCFSWPEPPQQAGGAGQGTGMGRETISFSAAEPPPDLFPMVEVRQLVDALIEEMSGQVLRLAPTEGLPTLRRVIADRLAGWGASLGPSNVLVTAGAQQGIDLLARSFLGAGDEVAVETPTYLGAIQAFRRRGARLFGIPVDDEGMRIDVLEQALARRPLKLVFTIPNFSNPSGAVLSTERRQRLLEITRRYQVPVVEDDVYGEIYFHQAPPPSLICFEPSDHVIYLGSLSKMMFPGLRVGWVAAPLTVVERLASLKQLADLQTATLSQWLGLRLLQGKLLNAHLLRVRPSYQERRDLLRQAIAKYCATYLTANCPDGGISLWCHLASGLRARDLLTEAARSGVTFVPGETFSVDDGARSHLRLAFGLASPAIAEEGARRLAQAIDSLTQRRPQRGPLATTPVV